MKEMKEEEREAGKKGSEGGRDVGIKKEKEKKMLFKKRRAFGDYGKQGVALACINTQ